MINVPALAWLVSGDWLNLASLLRVNVLSGLDFADDKHKPVPIIEPLLHNG